MKKRIVVFGILFCLAGNVLGCGNQSMVNDLAKTSSTKKEDTGKESTSKEKSSTGDTGDETETVSGKNVVDLTKLNSTMVYSEVYNMMAKPEDYVGKKVKMEGAFSVFESEEGKRYFSCIIQDATQCCAQGLEFELKEKRSYPDDYPKVDDEITVTGDFDTYQEEGYTYCVIKNAKMKEK